MVGAADSTLAAVPRAAAATLVVAAAADHRADAAEHVAAAVVALLTGAGGFLNQLQLLDVNFKLEKLGAEQLDGRETQHYRVTTDYRVKWADQAFPAHAVTEIWSAQLPSKIPNPFEPLVVTDQSTDGPLIEYALKLRAVRAQIEGTPVKVVTTTTFSDIRDIVGLQAYVGQDPTVDKLTVVQQTQITGIQPADVDPKLVAVPDNLDPGSPE